MASAASALMLVGLLLGSPLVIWVSSRAPPDGGGSRAVRRRTWGFVSTATLGATALEVSRARTHRVPNDLVELVPVGEGLGALSVAVLGSALVYGGPWPWVRRWLGRAALGWGGAMVVHGLSAG